MEAFLEKVKVSLLQFPVIFDLIPWRERSFWWFIYVLYWKMSDNETKKEIRNDGRTCLISFPYVYGSASPRGESPLSLIL